ncbi:alkaline phosphatase [Pontiellaceae bacterium B12227]|nr:alkaline phosphatase [Pontiellaceae bacterium B12227]
MNRRFFIGTLGSAAVALGAGRTQPHKPKYIFYMIGDGMGVAQREVAERYARMKYPSRKPRLVMNSLQVDGLTATVEVSGKVTDSAAAGTALACGAKTANGVLGLKPDLKTPLRSMAFDAKDAGMQVGIVTSVPIDHATPASFYAQVPKRSMYYEIDEFLAASDFDYFAGETMLGRKKAKGKTAPDKLVKTAGYQLVQDRTSFDALRKGDAKVVVEKDLGYAIEGAQDIPLADFTRKGIELLDNDAGFFMMVEGGKIDWSGHANDLATNVHETLAFDEAVAVALEFCKKHPDESLLVVTADHETGGLNLLEDKPLVSVIDAQKHQTSFYTRQVSKWKKEGTMDAESAYAELSKSFGIENLQGENKAEVLKAVAASLTDETTDTRSKEIQKMYGKKNAAVTSCLHALAAQAGAKWTSFGHTSTLVGTSAWGRWAEGFGGQNDNTDLGINLRKLILS